MASKQLQLQEKDWKIKGALDGGRMRNKGSRERSRKLTDGDVGIS